tara:strand:- start:416 stop:928 length:513 start_codon:yes stop_codon:yes gene_type:complete
MTKIKTKVEKAIETIVDHLDLVLMKEDYAYDIIDYEVDIESRTDLAKFYYDNASRMGTALPVMDIKCPHCLKAFVVLEDRAPEDTCTCVYKRIINPYHSGFSLRNLTAETYAKMFEANAYENNVSNPLPNAKQALWNKKYADRITVSRSFGKNTMLSNSGTTLGLAKDFA